MPDTASTSLWELSKASESDWKYDFHQICRLADLAEQYTGYTAVPEIVQFIMAEADRRHAAAFKMNDHEYPTLEAALDAKMKLDSKGLAERIAILADIKEAKSRLDADIAKDAPVHPVSAFLTGLAIHTGKLRAALSSSPAPSNGGSNDHH